MPTPLVGYLSIAFLISFGWVFPQSVFAQSSIAGIVSDSSGAVLPGVTVEAISPALIEGMRSAVTDAQGQYKLTNLQIGTYSVKFTLPGFTTITRQGIRLESNFTASVDVQMSIGGVEENITVTGDSPIVDVQTTQRREVVGRESIDTLPTARSFQTIASTLPAIISNRFDVGGSTQMWQGTVAAYGGSQTDFRRPGMECGRIFLGALARRQACTTTPARSRNTSFKPTRDRPKRRPAASIST